MRSLGLALMAAAVGLGACTADDGQDAGEPAQPAQPVALGPADGHDLPGTDLDRVQMGDLAPDFSLVSLAGPTVTLSSFRGQKNVVLVFYRGYW